jgi:hypothetical protein
MRKSVIGLIAIAAFVFSPLALAVAAAQHGGGHGGGGGGGGGGGAAMGGGGHGGAGSAGPSMGAGPAMHGSVSGPSSPSSGHRSFGGNTFAPFGQPTNRSSGTYSRGQKYSGNWKHDGDHRGHHHRHHRNGFAFFGGVYDGGYYPDYSYYDCYDWRRVHTRHGWRWRRVYVCDY